MKNESLLDQRQKIELLIGKCIITTVLIAILISSVGAILYFSLHGNQVLSYQIFKSEPSAYTSFFGIWHAALSFTPKGIMQLGILILVVGQSLRVLLTLWMFVKERDYFFCCACLFIFAVMLASLLGVTNNL